jgi:hypothetical protein
MNNLTVPITQNAIQLSFGSYRIFFSILKLDLENRKKAQNDFKDKTNKRGCCLTFV